MSLFAADGSINVAVVDGTTRTGLYSPAGAFYVVDATQDSGKGVFAPCGALRVTVRATGLWGVHAPDGSYNVTLPGSEATGPMRITVVDGGFVAP